MGGGLSHTFGKGDAGCLTSERGQWRAASALPLGPLSHNVLVSSLLPHSRVSHTSAFLRVLASVITMPPVKLKLSTVHTEYTPKRKTSDVKWHLYPSKF